MAKRKSKAVIMVANGAGGMAKVEDRRFERTDCPTFDVAKEQADRWFLYFDAECDRRGWSTNEIGQHERRENSGSITINTGAEAPQLTIVWERKRGGAITVSAGSARLPEFPSTEMHALFDQINGRCQSGTKERFYRRGQLCYNGLAWRGELWLDDTIRLGPPSQQYEAALLGPRVVLVDATVDSVGPRDANHEFSQRLQELSAFMSVVIDRAVRTPTQNEQSWTWTIADGTIACDVRCLGYVESQNSNQMPVQGTSQAVPLYSVTRPDFSFFVNNIIGAASELSIPADIADLWATYRSLTTGRRRQFLHAAAKWQEALTQSPDRHTLSFALMVVACEALKPSDRKFNRHNINHVVEALLGRTIAARLKSDWFRAQHVRSVHLHLGEFLGSEFLPGTTLSRFYDPTFAAAHRELADITRAAIIEWLRRGGTFSMPALKLRSRAVSPSKTRKPHSRHPSGRS